jgi:hypothetical protein
MRGKRSARGPRDVPPRSWVRVRRAAEAQLWPGSSHDDPGAHTLPPTSLAELERR